MPYCKKNGCIIFFISICNSSSSNGDPIKHVLFYILLLPLHSVFHSTRSFVHSSFVHLLCHLSIFAVCLPSLSFVCLPTYLRRMGRALLIMCPNHFSLRTSSINAVSPVIPLSSLMGILSLSLYSHQPHWTVLENLHLFPQMFPCRIQDGR